MLLFNFQANNIMNQVKIVEGTQSQSLLLKKLNTKYEYLSASRFQDEKYLSYLQSLQKLNKELIRMLQDPKWESHIHSINMNVQAQSKVSAEALQQQAQLALMMDTQGHVKNKEKVEVHEFYKSRIGELQMRIDELRSLMAQKESSFAKVLDRLSKYQQLHEPKLLDKLDDFDFIINDSFVKKIISKISSDKLKLAQELNSCRRELNQYESECYKLGKALSSKMNYIRYKEEVLRNAEAFEKSLESTGDIEAPHEDKSFRVSADPASNTKNLVNLIKKQKLINDSLQREFKQLIQVNEEIINYNHLLTKSNQNKQQQLRQVLIKISVLEKQTQKCEFHFNKTLRKSKSQQALEYQYLNLIQQQPLQHYMEVLKREVEGINIEDASTSKGLRKSYSMRSIYHFERGEEDLMGGVEEI